MERTPRSPDAKQLSRQILQTASRLFTAHGVEAVSMHRIAKSAGVGQGTLYRRYANKSDLCMELMRERFRSFLSDTDEELDKLHKEQTAVAERIYLYFDRLIAFVDEQTEWLNVLQLSGSLEGQTGAHKRDFFCSQPYMRISGTIAELLETAKAAGLARTVEPQSAAHMLVAALAPPMYMHLKYTLGLSREQVAAHFRSSFLQPMMEQVGEQGKSEQARQSRRV